MTTKKLTRAEKVALWRERKKSEGLCIRCGHRPPREGKPSCQQCHDKQHERYLRAKEENRHKVIYRKSMGLCTKCGIKIDPEDRYQGKQRATCDKCREKARARSLEKRINGNRYKALKRDHFTCQLCKSHRELTVHHINGKGDTSGKPDDRMCNLITLCRKCHSPITYLRRDSVFRTLAANLIEYDFID